MEFRIPIYKPYLQGNERKYVLDCIDSTWISSKGDYLEKFEKKFSDYIQIKYATAVTNGTVALHLALLAIGICDGDEVIVPTLTYIAPVNAIKYTGAKPVFVDSDLKSWQMDPKDVENKISSKTKAILAVHLYGHPCEMSILCDLSKKYGLFLIEDCSEALGSKFAGNHVGTFGDIATFSFYGNKTITTGEGGMVITNNATLYDRVKHFKGQGLAKYRQYWHDVIGYNYRMTNICAAIGFAQLELIDEILNKKRVISDLYKKAFLNTEIEVHTENENVYHSYWMFSILLPDNKVRDKIRSMLEFSGVETRPLFYPVHTMPMYSKRFSQYPIAENLGWRGINLPSYPQLTESEIEFICEIIKK